MIAIGIQMGGPEQKGTPIRDALLKATTIAASVRDADYNDGKNAWVNPIYLVPGSILRPEFEGYELGHFSKKEKGLVVKIEVPQSVADGKGINEFIGQSLREVVRLAASYFRSQEISFSTLKAEKIILSIEAALRKAEAG